MPTEIPITVFVTLASGHAKPDVDGGHIESVCVAGGEPHNRQTFRLDKRFRRELAAAALAAMGGDT